MNSTDSTQQPGTGIDAGRDYRKDIFCTDFSLEDGSLHQKYCKRFIFACRIITDNTFYVVSVS